MAWSSVSSGASPEKTARSSHSSSPPGRSPPSSSLKPQFLTVKTPLLPARSGITMDAAQSYGADVEKRALKGAELQSDEWRRDVYEQNLRVDASKPQTRAFRWMTAILVFFVSALAIIQGEQAYQRARGIVENLVKHDKTRVHVVDDILARQSASSNSTNSTYGTLVPLALKPLPLGSISPMGWLQAEMEGLANGLAGHEMDFYPIVSNSKWLGGSTDYSDLNEGLPYWLNGLVPLAYGLGDSRLISDVQNAAKYVIANQDPNTGMLGPVVYNDARDLWSRYPLMLGLRNMADADPTMTDTIVSTMYKFIPHANTLLADGSLAAYNEDWARSRYPDMILTLEWLFDNYPTFNGTDQRPVLWQMMNRLMNTGIDWAGYYTEGSYLFQDIDTVAANTADGGFYFPFLHGVNVGQGLKAMAVNYRFTHNSSLLGVQKNAVDWTMQYHGAASGTIIGDERESSLAPNRGSELCTTVETIFSMHTIYSITGVNEYADHAELAAFNALPVMLTADNWAHQYIAQPNQPWSAPVAGGDVFWNVGDFGITFGTSPNYPCCTVNHPQGYPKFTMATYMSVGDDGLAHVLLAPASATTKLGNGANVEISANTNYPFSDIITYHISTDKPFTFYVRVPGWASSPLMYVNGQQNSVSANSNTGLAPINVPAGKSTVQYILQSTLHTAARANDTIAIYRGALLYALDVGQVNTSVPGSADITRNQPPTSDQSVINALSYDSNATDISLASEPSQARDYNISNTLPWNYAVDETTLKFYAYNGSTHWDTANSPGTVELQGESINNSSSTMAAPLVEPIFSYHAPSQYVTAQACEIAWDLLGGTPFRPPLKGDRACLSDPVQVVFRPYGSLKLHMAELPTTSLNGTSS